MSEPIKDRDRVAQPLEKGLDKLLTPFENFRSSQSAAGIALGIAAACALILVNSPLKPWYDFVNHIELGVSFNEFSVRYSLHHWVNDGLMAIFFFVLGMEIKRECLVGDLRDFQKAFLVILMAAGGMLFPAGLYLLFVDTEALVAGWGVPMATDTAFALGVLALLGGRVPRTAATLLVALAIVDDIGAVLVIGLFYTESLATTPLIYALATWCALFGCNVFGVRRPLLYILGGVVLWWFVLHSGLHATIAGVMAAMAVPTRPYATKHWFMRRMRSILNHFERVDSSRRSILEEEQQHELVEKAQEVALKTATPIQHWSSVLDRPVSLIIMPVFAFLNAGVVLPANVAEFAVQPLVLAIFFGLVVGKGAGISLFAWVGLRSGRAVLPKGLHLGHIVGLGLLAGMGFTMSLFIAALAFAERQELLVQAKIAILSASLFAAVVGSAVLLAAHRYAPDSAEKAKSKNSSS